MADRIEINVDSQELLAVLKQLSKKLVDMAPAMRNVAGVLMDAVEQNFEEEGRPKWPVLSKTTIKLREKRGYWPGRILQMRGELASSITSKYDKDSAVVGTNKAYAAIHQFGGKAGRKKQIKIPARPYLKLSDDNIKEIEQEIKDYLEP